ncbi:NAF domain, partial [Dillenia turbinata]
RRRRRRSKGRIELLWEGMGFASNIGKYQLSRTIGEGTFAKVKLATNGGNGQQVAIKIIDKHMIMQNNLKYQANIQIPFDSILIFFYHVQREIRTMKLLHHPNIVRIHEVIGSKTKVYIVMEYVSGGQLSDKLAYVKRLEEWEARKIFQQLIDAVDYCHSRGVYHRDLKPENLLLDGKGNLKVSDFGLSALRKPGDLLSTACGSPSYVAPELLVSKSYEGAAADVWSCGVILFELLAGFLPFDDRNLMSLYRKISRAEYACPEWFTEKQKKLLKRILEPNSRKRITIPELIETDWFQKDYEPSSGYELNESVNLDDVHAAFDVVEENAMEAKMPKSATFINAFQLIAMSHDLDLSGLFQDQAKVLDEDKQKTRLGSQHTINETIKKIEAAAKDVSLSVERMNNSKVKMIPKQKMTRCARSYFDLSAEVIEVAPAHCVVEISKSAGELRVYKEFCKSLSSLLTESSDVQEENKATLSSQYIQGPERSEQNADKDNTNQRGYSSS